jgi:methionyl-tRNA synthetase
VKLTLRCFDGLVPQPEVLLEPEDKGLLACAGEAVAAVTSAVENMKLDRGLETVMNVVRAGNRYMEQTAPWTLAKEGKTKRLATVLYTAAETLRIVSGLLFPVMPEKMAELRRTIGMSEEDCRSVSFDQIRSFGTLRPGSRMQDIAALFPRIQTEKPSCAAAPAEKKKEPRIKEKKSVVIPEGIITIADLQKVRLRAARILSAERIADAERLLSLKIDLGNGDVRPLVAGIAKFYEPETLTGKTIVVVENLLPTVIRKHESRGMLLAARDGERLRLVTVDGECAPGSEIG